MASNVSPGDEDGIDADRLLDVLADSDCRAMLSATAETPLTVKELVDRCEVPLSTAYRKIKTLVDLGVVEERTRVRPRSRNACEYSLRISAVQIDITELDLPDSGLDCCDLDANTGSTEGLSGILRTDGGCQSEEGADTVDDRVRHLHTIFVALTGTDRVVESQRRTPSVRIVNDADETPTSESLPEYLTTLARNDGLSETIDGPDPD